MIILENGMYQPDCADEWLEVVCGIAVDYDNCNTVDTLKELVDEMVAYTHKARECLRENKIF